MVSPIDPTTMHTAAEAILAVLELGAADTGWEPARACVTPGPVGVDCDSLFVWPDAITPIRDQAGQCPFVLRTRFQYVIAVCVGTNSNPTCSFWETNAPKSHDAAWGVQAYIVQDAASGNLCGAACTDVRFGDFTLLTNDGGFSWWQGSVQIDLSPEKLAS
jgi:hypothetical protein